jgi:hypothetical protein
MTKADAVRGFKRDVLPIVRQRYGRRDRAAMREAWNEWVDYLCREGRITERQAATWDSPMDQRG